MTAPKTFPVSAFSRASGTRPTLYEPTLDELAAKLAPETPPIRTDLVAARRHAERRLAQVEAGDDFRSVGWERVALRKLDEGESLSDVLKWANRLFVDSFKLQAPAWSPATYDPPKRRNSHVASVSCVVFDLDAGDPLDRCWELFDGHARLLHTSWSHSSQQPRCRVVVPLAEPVPAERWGRTWRWAASRARSAGLLGVDRSTKDRGRAYLLPAVASAEAAKHYEARRDLHSPLLEVPPDLPDPEAEARYRRRREIERNRKLAVYLPGPSPRWWKDPLERTKAAQRLGCSIGENKAKGATCPGCGQRSVWFLVEPDRMYRARCDHRKSCGWTGTLEELGGQP